MMYLKLSLLCGAQSRCRLPPSERLQLLPLLRELHSETLQDRKAHSVCDRSSSRNPFGNPFGLQRRQEQQEKATGLGRKQDKVPEEAQTGRRMLQPCWGWPEEGAAVEGVMRRVGKMRPLGKKCLDKSRDPADLAKARRHSISGSGAPYWLRQRRAPP